MGNAPSPTRIYEACFVEMGKTLRTAQFYPIKHPAFRRSLERSFLYLSQLLKRTGALDVTITKSHIHVDDKPVSGNQQVLGFLASECFRRRIKQLHFEPQVDIDDYLALYTVLSRDAREVQDAGGAERLLAGSGARNLWANALRFDAKQLSEVAEEPEPIDEQTVDEILTEARQPHDELRRNLEALPAARDARKLRTLLHEIVEEVRQAIGNDDLVAAMLAASVLARMAEQHGAEHPRSKAYAAAIRAVAAPKVVELIVARMGRAIADTWESYSTTLRWIGPEAIPLLLSALIQSESRKERLRLLATIRSYGPAALKPTLQLLQDGRWFVLRNGIELVGAVGSPKVVSALQPFLNHDHPKVRQAARGALRQLGGEAALRLLIAATQEQSEADRRHAVSQLGFFPAAAVMPTILELIERGSAGVAQEALHVLSELEPPDLLAFLEHMLRERGGLLQRRRRETLRQTAAELICLRLPDTWSILKQYAEDPDPEIRKWVARGVEWMQRARKREAMQA